MRLASGLLVSVMVSLPRKGSPFVLVVWYAMQTSPLHLEPTKITWLIASFIVMGHVSGVLNVAQPMLFPSRATIRIDADSFCLMSKEKCSRSCEEEKAIWDATLVAGCVRQKYLVRIAYRLLFCPGTDNGYSSLC
jgi:hypothetical protein